MLIECFEIDVCSKMQGGTNGECCMHIVPALHLSILYCKNKKGSKGEGGGDFKTFIFFSVKISFWNFCYDSKYCIILNSR